MGYNMKENVVEQANMLRLSWDDVITVNGTRGIIIEENNHYGVWSTVENDIVVPAVYDKYNIQVPVIILSDRDSKSNRSTAIYNRYTDQVMTISDSVHSTRVRSGLKFISFRSRRLLIFRMNNGKLLFDGLASELQYPAFEAYGVAAFIKLNGVASVVLTNGNIITSEEYIKKEYKLFKRCKDIEHTGLGYSSIYSGEYMAMTHNKLLYVLDNYGMVISAIRKSSPTYKYIQNSLGCD